MPSAPSRTAASRAVVAEKPSVARDIAAALGARTRRKGYISGNGVVVTWALGHLVRQAEPHEIDPQWKRWRRDTLPMLPRDWPLVVGEKVRAQFETVRRILTSPKIRGVICATDAGREGELIFRQLYEAAGSTKPVERLWISSLTPAAIRQGFRDLRPSREFDRLADAARARSRADWLVGLNLTRAYTLDHRRAGSGDELLSVGRVQTPTLAMLVERELAIRNFVPEDYLEVAARFDAGEDRVYRGTYFKLVRGKRQTRLAADGEEAARILRRADSGRADIKEVRKAKKRIPPPLLYDLTELQRHANRLYGYSADRTLDILQRLYERHKAITYPRTDSRHLSTQVAAQLPSIAQQVAARYDPALIAPGCGGQPLSKRFVDDSKVTDHHAIIPTGAVAAGVPPGSAEAKLLDLVGRRFLQAWHPDHVYSSTTVVSRIAFRAQADLYLSQGTAVEREGWKVLDVKTKKQRSRGRATLPGGLKTGLPLKVLEAKAVKKRTKPPPRLTDATLLTSMESAGKTVDDKQLSRAMKDRGLGTPATRASIIETLLKRGYIRREKKQFWATDRGIGLLEVVHPKVRSAAMTGEWEAMLRSIERGSGSFDAFMQGIEQFVREVVSGSADGKPAASPAARDRPSAQSARPAGGAAAASTGHDASPAPAGGGRVEQSLRGGPPAPDRTRQEGVRPPTEAGIVQQAAPARPQPATSKFAAKPWPPPNGGGQAAQARPPGPARRLRPSIPPSAPGGRQPAALQPPASADASPERLRELLRSRFGHPSFRPHQEQICREVIAGKDVLVVMPTGAGKSLCYQLPGIARGATTLVVSPLIALMEDQTDKLRQLGFRAERIHSGRDRSTSQQVCRDYLAGQLDFLYIAPERLGVPGFPELLARRTPGLVAIDEAHCISMWGHDFRPDYRRLKERVPALRPAPVIALTATATPRVQKDIVEQLALDNCRQSIHGFRRDNLEIELVELVPSLRPPALLRLLRAPDRRPAIVYAPTRKASEEQAETLQQGLGAAAYHAGMDAEQRERIQTAFLRGDLDVIVATIAFGMGIDKADVRTVVHTGLPGSIEGYYQEIGRAGRDGLPSRAVLLHSWADRKLHEFFLERDYPEPETLELLFAALSQQPVPYDRLIASVSVDIQVAEKAVEKLWTYGGVQFDGDQNAFRGTGEWRAPYVEQRNFRYKQLDLVLEFTRSQDCRMLDLVRHFGDLEDSLKPCGQCDNCDSGGCVVKRFRPPTVAERQALESVLWSLQERDFQASGRLFKEHAEQHSIRLPQFYRLVDAAERADLLRTHQDSFVNAEGKYIEFRRVGLGGGAAEASSKIGSLKVVEERAGLAHTKRRRAKKRAAARPPGKQFALGRRTGQGPADDLVEAALAAWRKEEAKRRKIPAFRIFTNQTLAHLAALRPGTTGDLLAVRGIGKATTKNYGSQILEVIRKADQ